MSGHKAIIELHYLPSIPFMATWMYFDEIIIESKETFDKQTYRNRCTILTANKIENLIVPVQKGNQNVPIQEIRIDHSQDWINKHWRAIQTAYGSAPFFDHFKDSLQEILYKKHRFLFDLNLELFEFLLDTLGMEKNILFTRVFEKEYPDEVTDLRSVIHPKKTTSCLEFYRPVEYLQVFGKHFVEDLCVIDLIFNEGLHAIDVMRESISYDIDH